MAPATPTISPATPIATLSVEQALTSLTDLLENNGDCRLPCLWGLTPGETDTIALDQFLAQFGQYSETDEIVLRNDRFGDIGGLSLSFRDTDLRVHVNLSYYLADNKLEQLVLSANALSEIGAGEQSPSQDVFGNPTFNELLSYYSLPSILSTYGQPTQVLLAPFYDDPAYPPLPWLPFSLVLYYEPERLLVEYVMPREIVGDKYSACPERAHLKLTVWQFDQPAPISEVAHRLSGYGLNELNVDYFKPLEIATTMNLNGFYDTYREPETQPCLQTPVTLWPQP